MEQLVVRCSKDWAEKPLASLLWAKRLCSLGFDLILEAHRVMKKMVEADSIMSPADSLARAPSSAEKEVRVQCREETDRIPKGELSFFQLEVSLE